jgi:uncharacterized protein
MSLRVLADTNVLVSAFIAGGPPSRIIEEAIGGRIELVLATPVLAELERVLTVKLRFEPERVREIGTLLTDLAQEILDTPVDAPEPVTGDPDDDPILACAIDAEVKAIVSGDRRHLLPVGEHRGVRIISPQALLAELAEQQVRCSRAHHG